MLRNWTEVLPLFIVRHLAQTKCETIRQNGLLVKVPRPGVMIQIENITVAETRAAAQVRGRWLLGT
jgi:hypothetical protein